MAPMCFYSCKGDEIRGVIQSRVPGLTGDGFNEEAAKLDFSLYFSFFFYSIKLWADGVVSELIHVLVCSLK